MVIFGIFTFAANMTRFAVIEFLDEGTVTVVPVQWLVKISEVTIIINLAQSQCMYIREVMLILYLWQLLS